MGKISELLRWKDSLVLKNQKGEPLETVWVRIIGDYDLQEAYRLARVASSEKRRALRDVDSTDFKDQVLIFAEGSEEECKALIKASRGASWASQAFSVVVRGDEVKIDEIAVDPDAPTLEEQEKLDEANKKVEIEYSEAINEYIRQKEVELDTELASLSLEDLRLQAQVEATVMLPLTTFMSELQEQKVWRAVYDDKECKKRSFSSIEEFRDSVDIIKEQLIEKYNELEVGLDEIKN